MIELIKPYRKSVVLTPCDYKLQEGEEMIGEYTKHSCWIKSWVPLTPLEEKVNELIRVVNDLVKGRSNED